jgi:cell division protein FtsI/penicillin-binding protein 2
MAWGQGELIATPISIARVSAGIANNGILMPNRFVLKISDSAIGAGKGIAITKDPKYAQLMTRFMQEQSASKVDKLGLKVAGKTGTPERIVRQQRINDGWYTFFAPKANGAGHIVVCVRIEDAKGSSVAVRMAGKHVIPKLLELGYVKSFETEEPGPRKTDNMSVEQPVKAIKTDEQETDSL